MEITINGITLGSNTYKLGQPVEGLEIPPIRTSQDNYSGRDGGRVNGQFYSPRLITLSGFMNLTTCALHEDARQDLEAALPIRQDLAVTVTNFSGTSYTITVRLVDFKMPITSPRASLFKIDLVASDPYFYSSSILSATIPLAVGGGFVLPAILPVTFGAGTSPTTITNNGTVVTYPTITIVGSATNPSITNTVTGEKVELSLTMSGGDTLVINMKDRTITLNGGSVLSLRTADSDWFGLAVGVNKFIYETTNAADTGVTAMTWRTGVVSI